MAQFRVPVVMRRTADQTYSLLPKFDQKLIFRTLDLAAARSDLLAALVDQLIASASARNPVYVE
jgi:hypothetical protein